MSDSAVRVRELRKKYGDLTAVDGIDLDIARGEVFALLGPNGAGKTTTVEILEGHRRRDGGEVSVLGEDPGRAGRLWRSKLGIVLQSATDAAEFTVRETVHHFASYFPRPRDPDSVIELVGLAGKADAHIRHLSGGQRRRVDVALGVVGNPELLFLDEPTTGFDPEARRQFWGLISLLSDEGTTIVLTTHYLDEAEALASRVGVIAKGRVVAIGEPATLAGRAEADATVSWSTPDGERRVKTPTPTKVVAELIAQYDGEIPDLTVRRPTLEDTYLGLIGEQL
ncbi:ATP-binding cassette domain-containing protein [Streptosporangium sp. LJ11]|uniref:ABC transporter ATP-binding protein n=1 Tax=Streptosporangium sp. LJ11 TaxID=3436927 RepID=UPI003F79F8BC